MDEQGQIEVHAFVAVDHEGNWAVYGFPTLGSLEHFHETGVTEDIKEPTNYYRITCKVKVPTAAVAIRSADVRVVPIAEHSDDPTPSKTEAGDG